MSRYSGAQHAGAARVHQERKRKEAEARNAVTPEEKRRSFRRDLDAALQRVRGSQGTTKQRQVKGK